jgi:hypothetical protein
VQSHSETGAYQDSIKATGRLALWTLAWAASVALAKFGPGPLWDSEQSAVSWAAVAVNVVVGVGWIIAFMRFLRALDELDRKIMLDTLAITLGVGWVGGFAYVVADAAGLVSSDVDVAVLAALLGGVYMITFVVGKIRYR